MSLFTTEEICDGCFNANWHHCDKCSHDKSFCHCGGGHDIGIDHTQGKCEYKVEKDEAPENWFRFHHMQCGTIYRGCHPTKCPKHVYEETGRWIGEEND